MTAPHISTQELKDAYTRAHLFRIGMTFDQACAIRTVRWALEKSALARRRRYALPEQPRLI
jgi:hypothetical protein